MAVAIQELRKLQGGKETTKGTGVAATKQFVGEWTWSEEIDKYFSDYPRGIRANTGGNGTDLRKGTVFDYESELSPEEIIAFLNIGILGGQTPATVDTSGRLWTYTPGLAGAPTLDAFTFELIESDGATNHYTRECAYSMVESFKISRNFNQIARFNAKVFARALQTSVPTAALAPYVGRENLSSNGTSLWIDSTWAGLGTTQIVGAMRSIESEYMTGLGPKYNLDGRPDLDMFEHRYGKVGATVNITMDLEAQAATQWANYRAGTRIFLRARTSGSLIVAQNKFVQEDLSLRFTQTPSVSTDGSIRTVSFQAETVYDDTSAKLFEIKVQNTQTAVA